MQSLWWAELKEVGGAVVICRFCGGRAQGWWAGPGNMQSLWWVNLKEVGGAGMICRFYDGQVQGRWGGVREYAELMVGGLEGGGRDRSDMQISWWAGLRVVGVVGQYAEPMVGRPQVVGVVR